MKPCFHYSSFSSEIHAPISKIQLKGVIEKPQSHLKLNIPKFELIIPHFSPPLKPSSFKLPISENGWQDVILVPSPCQFSLVHQSESPEDTLQAHLIFSFPKDTALIQTINFGLDY